MMKEELNNTSIERAEAASRNNLNKMLVLISMIVIGILLIAYRIDFEYWSDQFIAYNQILFTAALAFFIILLIIMLKDLKSIIKRELLGTIIFGFGAVILMLVPARNIMGLGDGVISIFFTLGGIIVLIGMVFLMRSGGYFSVSLISLLIIMLVSAFYMFGSSNALQYNENTFLITTYAIIFLIICFILLVYDDVKYFYLAKLIKDERLLRKKKEYKKALAYCNRAILIYPFFAPAWNNKGNVYMNMGKKKDALVCYKKALGLNPNYEPAISNLKAVKRYQLINSDLFPVLNFQL